MSLRSMTPSQISSDAQAPSLATAKLLAPAEATIVCGTDFSAHAGEAVEAAAALAKRLGEPLVLAHAVDTDSRSALPAELRDSLCIYDRAQLHDELDRLRAANVEVIEAFGAGRPDAVLVETAAAHHARLLVLSSRGHKPPGRWILGSVAERTAEASPVPTLVVRDAAPFTGWALGTRRLRVFVGADFSAASEAALRWVAWLRELGQCDVVVAYLEAVAVAPDPLDLVPSPSTVEMLASTERMQMRYFRQRVRALVGTSRVRVRIEKGWGRSDAHLIQVARDERADLIVVGTHQRHGVGRVGHLSVSRGVLHYAPMSVACIPINASLEQRPHENQLH